MTSFFRRKTFLGLLFFSVSFYGLQAQSDLTNFLQAGKEDASKLMSSYMDPIVVGLSYGLNGGWYHTAKAHKTLGFDIGVSFNAVFIPSSHNTFRPGDLNLANTQLISPTSGDVPTVVGPEVDSEYETSLVTPAGTQTISFDGPPGLDFKDKFKISGVLAPTVQVGLGIYKNTDLKFRFVPEQSFDDTKIGLIGFGLMHDIKQHIPGLKLLPFDLSVLAGYTKISGSVGMEGLFDKPANDLAKQEMNFEINAWLFQALISKKIAIITFYGGIGYNAVKSSSDVTGSYVIYEDSQNSSNNVTIKDPVSLAFKNNSFRLTGGIRFNLGPLYLNGDYSIQEYNTLSVGLGFAFR